MLQQIPLAHDAIDISNHEISQTDVPRADYGSQTLITSSTIQVVLGSQGLLIPNIGGTYNVQSSNFTTYPYIKVVASSGGGGGTGGANVTTDTVAPTNPSDGDLWFDESVGKLYVYVDTTSSWVQTNGGGGGGGGGQIYAQNTQHNI